MRRRSRSRSATARSCEPAAEALARAPLHGQRARALARRARARRRARRRGQGRGRASAQASSTSRRRSTSGARPSSRSGRDGPNAGRARRRSTTRSSSPGSGTAIWPASPPTRPSSRSTPTAPPNSAGRRPRPGRLRHAQQLVDDTRAALLLNVSEELACEALAHRWRRRSPPAPRACSPQVLVRLRPPQRGDRLSRRRSAPRRGCGTTCGRPGRRTTAPIASPSGSTAP